MTLKYIKKIKGAADKNDVKSGTCERSRRWQYIGILLLWRVCAKTVALLVTFVLFLSKYIYDMRHHFLLLILISLYFAQINLIRQNIIKSFRKVECSFINFNKQRQFD